MSLVADEALLAGMAAGDREATVAFVRRFQSRAFGIALGILGDRQLAEEVAQDSFVKAWTHAANYDARRGSVAAWLLTITRNAALDVVRSRRVRPSDPTDPVDPALRHLLSPDHQPEAAALSTDEVRRTMAALAELPAEQRRAVVLATYAGYTAQEVGDACGIPLGTAKTRIRTGLQRLRAVLVDDMENR